MATMGQATTGDSPVFSGDDVGMMDTGDRESVKGATTID